MAIISALTSSELSGTGIGPSHGVAMTRLNEIITQLNTNTTAIAGASNPYNYVGSIALPANFPTSAVVTAGDVYKVTADVADSDGTKTNTGQTFLAGTDIVWDGSAWIEIGLDQSTGIVTVTATPYDVAEGVHTVLVDTATIAAASTINLPALTASRKSRSITIIDCSSGAGTDNISVTPDGTDEIDGVNAAKDITINDGAMSVVTDGVAWFTNASTAHSEGDGTDHANVVLNDTHRASDGTDHANVVLNDTHRASDGTDHANVVLNDTHRASDGTDHANVVLNDTHRASDGTDHANVVLNDTHRASDGTDHANVVLNDTHRAADGKDHSDVVLNNTHRANVDPKLVQVVITATGGTGGSTAGTISVQVNDLAGNAISRAVNIRLDISDTEGAGSLDAATTCQFGAASTGTLVIGNGAAAAIVTTDATGLYEGALSNAADETNYFSASSTPGGAAALANGCDVVECAIESATWSA